MVRITEVHLNHNTDSHASDAINIRSNQIKAPIQAPEWQEYLPPKPAAYALAGIKDSLTIKAKFSGGPKDGSLMIRAVAASDASSKRRGCLRGLAGFIFGTRKSGRCTVLGNVKQSQVDFDSGGNSKLQEFQLVDSQLKSAGVGILNFVWRWQVRKRTRWVDMGVTEHKVYVTLGVPNGPWTQELAAGGEDNPHLPWTEALEVACRWAEGARSQDEAATLITTSVNENPALLYTTSTIFHECFSPDISEDCVDAKLCNYHFSFFLEQLGTGRAFRLNCTDCANAVTTLANLLGCNLFEGRICPLFIGKVPFLLTRKILPIGGDPTANNEWLVLEWGYHELAWLGRIGHKSYVFDACLRLNKHDDINDTHPVPTSVFKIQFGKNSPDGYAYRLLQYSAYRLDFIGRRRSLR